MFFNRGNDKLLSYSPVILIAAIFQVHLIRGDLEFRVICSFRNLKYKKDTDVIKKEKLDCWLFLLPNLLGVAVFALIPMLEVLLGAFRSAVGGEWVGLLNFQTVVENRAFRLAAWNTARFMMICIPLLLSISLLMALGLKHIWAVCQLRSAFLLPMAVPAASVVLVWKLLFHENGLINVLLLQLHLPSVSWMTTGASFWMLVISYLWKNLGYTRCRTWICISVFDADSSTVVVCFVSRRIGTGKPGAEQLLCRCRCKCRTGIGCSSRSGRGAGSVFNSGAPGYCRGRRYPGAKCVERLGAGASNGQAVRTASLSTGGSNSARISQITYEQMEEDLKKLEALRDAGGKVLAPTDGVVTACYVHTGQMTSDTTALLLAGNSQGWHFTADLTPEQSKYIGTGDQVTLRLESNDKEYKELPVIAFSSTDTGATVTVDVASDEIPLGASMELRFTRKSQAYHYCIPLTALHMDERNQPYVLTVGTVNTVLGEQTQAVKVYVMNSNTLKSGFEAMEYACSH